MGAFLLYDCFSPYYALKFNSCGRYAAMKRQIEAQEMQVDRKPKKQKAPER
jgi:hypothetical protein